mmetsp:Transcript_10895/g.20122  ORF Transcript_10895/g.20122 Transcript_10895/m.20122 type:complete len:202 (-) Transcript_10895:762-1367(-)
MRSRTDVLDKQSSLNGEMAQLVLAERLHHRQSCALINGHHHSPQVALLALHHLHGVSGAEGHVPVRSVAQLLLQLRHLAHDALFAVPGAPALLVLVIAACSGTLSLAVLEHRHLIQAGQWVRGVRQIGVHLHLLEQKAMVVVIIVPELVKLSGHGIALALHLVSALLGVLRQEELLHGTCSPRAPPFARGGVVVGPGHQLH